MGKIGGLDAFPFYFERNKYAYSMHPIREKEGCEVDEKATV